MGGVAAGEGDRAAGRLGVPGRFARRLALILLGGAVLRVLYTVLVAPWPSQIPSDDIYYHGWANAIAAGRGFIDPFSIAGHPSPTAAHPPLYPLLLSLVAKLGGTGEVPQRLAGTVIGAVTILFIALLARRLAGDRAGLCAALLAAIYPIFITADGALLSETLFGALVAASLWAAHRLYARRTIRRAVGLGVLVGAAALTRGEGLLLAPLLALPLVRPGALRLAAAVILATLLVLTPWTVRNQQVFGRFVLVSTDTGSLVGGANCQATYYGAQLGEWWQPCIIDSAAALRRYVLGNEAAVNNVLLRRGLRYAGNHAGRMPAVIAVRELRTWGLYDPFAAAESRDQIVLDAGIVMYYLLAVGAGVGLVALRRQGRPVWVLVAPVLLVTITVGLTYGRLRFREPADVAIVVLAGVGLESVRRRRGAGRQPVARAAGSPSPAGAAPPG